MKKLKTFTHLSMLITTPSLFAYPEQPFPQAAPQTVNWWDAQVQAVEWAHPITYDMYGPVIEIEAPEIGGVRFTGDGKKMMGFLEPKWFKK